MLVSRHKGDPIGLPAQDSCYIQAPLIFHIIADSPVVNLAPVPQPTGEVTPMQPRAACGPHHLAAGNIARPEYHHR